MLRMPGAMDDVRILSTNCDSGHEGYIAGAIITFNETLHCYLTPLQWCDYNESCVFTQPGLN